MRHQLTSIELLKELMETIPDGDACTEWPRARDSDGYGSVFSNGKISKAHRVAYELAHGPIPEGSCVLHKCDNPPCFRPDHLFTGSQGDNIRDRDAKRRANRSRGETHYHAKVTQGQVEEIRRSASAGETHVSIGMRFGLKQPQVSSIVARKSWAHT